MNARRISPCTRHRLLSDIGSYTKCKHNITSFNQNNTGNIKVKEKAGKCRLTLKTYFDEISFAYALIRKLRRFNIRDRKMKVDTGRL